MLKDLGALMGLAKQLPRIKEEMERMQQRVAAVIAEGDAGAGLVRVRVNGRLEVLSCTISEEALRGGDREMLEDLVRGATNQALAKAKQLAGEEARKMAQELGLPSGLELPGLMPGG